MSLPVALRPPAPPHQHPHGGDGGGGGGGGADRGAANGLVSRRVGLGGTSRYSAGGIPEEETGEFRLDVRSQCMLHQPPTRTCQHSNKHFE